MIETRAKKAKPFPPCCCQRTVTFVRRAAQTVGGWLGGWPTTPHCLSLAHNNNNNAGLPSPEDFVQYTDAAKPVVLRGAAIPLMGAFVHSKYNPFKANTINTPPFNQPTHLPTNQTNKRPTNQPTNQPTNHEPTTNERTNQNRPTNQPTE